MAASIRKFVPLTLNLLRGPVTHQRIVCSCKNKLNVQQVWSAEPLSHCLSTSTRYLKNETKKEPTVKEQNVVTKQTQQETETEEYEPDVLYKKLIIEVKGHDAAVLKSYTQFVKQTSKHLELELIKCYAPPKYIYRQSVLKSVHIFKKHFAQYEERTYFQVYEFVKMTGSTADTFLEYIQRNLPEGVAMKVTKHRLEKLPQHLKLPTKTAQIRHSTS